MNGMTFRSGNVDLEPVVAVLDDNRHVLELYWTILHSEGYRVKSFSANAQLLARGGHAPFDALITELMVSGEDTLPLVKEIKDRNPQTYVVLATRYDIADSVYPTLLKNGVDEVLNKPFSLQALLSNLNKVFLARRGFNGYRLNLN